MMKFYYDLHIHSALSPCADNTMTPNNIINMAIIKGLDFISITDHNSAKNLIAIQEVAKEKSVVIIPGIEVETIEGIHLVCYFQSIEQLLAFQTKVYESLPVIDNNPKVLGEQLVMDENDEIIHIEKTMLLNSCHYKLNECIELVHSFKGLVSLAHIDRNKNSIITILGFIPKDLSFDMIEISQRTNSEVYVSEKKLEGLTVLQNSDAHYLGDISEATHYVELYEKSIVALFNYLRGE